ncbi:hemagglutinin repeat-containing protein [Pseudovibrio sp. WM33]|uniref:hemagglutinin repeat-containing protein n=1 Tax=Pseudovibrio sp. WM33 TaxID=1735585 RepID=UPI00406D3116
MGIRLRRCQDDDRAAGHSERSAGIKGTVGVGLNGVSVGVSGSVSGQNSKGHNTSNTKTNALVKAGEGVSIDQPYLSGPV